MERSITTTRDKDIVNANGFISQCRQCIHIYIAQRSTSMYCPSSCRANAHNEKREPGSYKVTTSIWLDSVDKSYLNKLYEYLHQLHGGNKQVMEDEAWDYLFESDSEEGKTAVLKELEARSKFHLSCDDCLEIYEKKYEGYYDQNEKLDLEITEDDLKYLASRRKPSGHLL